MMEQAATQRTPLIEINEALCRMVGECYPENIQEFSAPVMSSLRSLVPDTGTFTVELELFYFNSSSAKFFFDFFEFFSGFFLCIIGNPISCCSCFENKSKFFLDN